MKLNFLYVSMLSAYCSVSKSSYDSWGITFFFLYKNNLMMTFHSALFLEACSQFMCTADARPLVDFFSRGRGFWPVFCKVIWFC